jgi:hypothetical protein
MFCATDMTLGHWSDLLRNAGGHNTAAYSEYRGLYHRHLHVYVAVKFIASCKCGFKRRGHWPIRACRIPLASSLVYPVQMSKRRVSDGTDCSISTANNASSSSLSLEDAVPNPKRPRLRQDASQPSDQDITNRSSTTASLFHGASDTNITNSSFNNVGRDQYIINAETGPGMDLMSVFVSSTYLTYIHQIKDVKPLPSGCLLSISSRFIFRSPKFVKRELANGCSIVKH